MDVDVVVGVRVGVGVATSSTVIESRLIEPPLMCVIVIECDESTRIGDSHSPMRVSGSA